MKTPEEIGAYWLAELQRREAPLKQFQELLDEYQTYYYSHAVLQEHLRVCPIPGHESLDAGRIALQTLETAALRAASDLRKHVEEHPDLRDLALALGAA